MISEPVGTDSNVLKVKFADIQMQRNSYDCRLYAIANATALANGCYPAQESYNAQSTTMRRHLIGCLENKFLLPFPTHNTGYKAKRRQAKIKKILEMPLYCICKKPDTGALYIYCDSCQKEYHPECLGISSSVNESTLVVCNTCRKKILNNILQSILGTVFCCFILFLVFCCCGTYVTKQRNESSVRSPEHLSYKTTERNVPHVARNVCNVAT